MPDGVPSGDSMPKTPRTRAAFNTQFLDDIAEAEKVGRNARIARYADLLNDWDITPAMVTQMLTLASETGVLMRGAQSSHAQSSVSSDEKDAAERRIIAAILRIQSGARRKFGTDGTQLNRFFIGTRLETAEEQLDEMAEAILQILASETLPGVKAPQIAELRAALDGWDVFATDQDEHSTAGVSGNAQVRSNMKRINQTRRAIQASIDGEFPFIAKHENAQDQGARIAAREAFNLAVKHPFV